jgi:phosphatidylinositol glycan class B
LSVSFSPQVLLPSLLQAVLAALTDLYTYKLARKLLNERAAWITVSMIDHPSRVIILNPAFSTGQLVPTVLSLYTFHTSTRTLSNSTEAAFTIIALYYWPLSLPENSDDDLIGEMPLIDAKSLETSLVFFALSSVLRPSNVLISLPLLLIMVHKVLRTAKSTATLVESAMTLLVVGRICLYIG